MQLPKETLYFEEPDIRCKNAAYEGNAIVAWRCVNDEWVQVGSYTAALAVPRAEATAVLKALQLPTGAVELATDADYVMRRFARLQTSRGLACTNPDVWAQIRTLKSQRDASLHKVKAHLSREAFVAQYPTSLVWHWIGNTCADNLSQKHAEQLVDQAWSMELHGFMPGFGRLLSACWRLPDCSCTVIMFGIWGRRLRSAPGVV